MLHRLARPRVRAILADAGHCWRWCSIDVVTERPHLLEDLPDLADRIRGAWGRALDRSAKESARIGVALGDCTARDILFSAPRLPSIDGARPYAIRAQMTAERIAVQLKIFGFACHWADEAALALCEGLKGGIALKRGCQRIPLPVKSVQTNHFNGVRTPDSGHHNALLQFRSPLVYRDHDATKADVSKWPMALLRRIRALARWNDFDLSFDESRFRTALRQLRIDDNEMILTTWQRRSQHHRKGPQHVLGRTGPLRISGPLDEWMPVFALGEVCHASGGSLGLGSFDLIPY